MGVYNLRCKTQLYICNVIGTFSDEGQAKLTPKKNFVKTCCKYYISIYQQNGFYTKLCLDLDGYISNNEPDYECHMTS